jgi:adenylate cyclase
LKKALKKTIYLNLLIVSVLLAGLGILGVLFKQAPILSPFKSLDNVFLDLAVQMRSYTDQQRAISPEDILIVDIDDASIETLGRVQLWPRAYDARVIEAISSGEPKAIGVDILYTEPDTLSSAYADILKSKGFDNPSEILNALSTDSLLQKAIETSDCVYLSLFDDDKKPLKTLGDSFTKELRVFYTDSETASKLTLLVHPVLPFENFRDAPKGIATISMASELDGVVRKYRLAQRLPVASPDESAPLVLNLAALMAVDAFGVPMDSLFLSENEFRIGRKLQVPVSNKGEFRLNWLGSEEKFRYISFYKVLQGLIPKELFKDKVVFIGTSAAGLQDIKTTPTINRRMPGVEVHATAYYNLINASFFNTIPLGALAIVFVVLTISLTLAFYALRPVYALGLLLILIFVELLLFIFVLFPQFNLVLPLAYIMSLSGLSFIVSAVYRYLTQEKDRMQMKAAFETYVAPDLVSQVLKNSDSLKLGGEKKELTVLFSDIRGFTSYSEGLDPEALVHLLNNYLDRMSEAVFQNKGTIDKFIGDAVMAIFGAPVAQENHADLACRSALDMLSELKRINEIQTSLGEPELKIGIGINTGEMTVGNIGSEKRFDYTVIGDAVNLGSRLEGLNKYFKTRILISQSTLEASTKTGFLYREIGPIRVKGREDAVRVYELLGTSDKQEEYKVRLEAYNKALGFYHNQKFKEALTIFEETLNIWPMDGPSEMYCDLCKTYIAEPTKYQPMLIMESK